MFERIDHASRALRSLGVKEGDIVSIDTVALKNGFNGDAARTFIVGETSKENKLSSASQLPASLLTINLSCLFSFRQIQNNIFHSRPLNGVIFW